MDHAVDRASDIAIIGYDGRFPGAENPREFWRNLRAGVNGIRQFTAEELEAEGVPARELADPNYVLAAPILTDIEYFDAAFFGIGPRDAEVMDPQQRIFLEVCWAALEHAGYDPGGFTDRVGVFAGARTNTYLLHLLSHRELIASVGAFTLGLSNDLGFMTTRLSHCLNLTGPSCAVQTACSTSLVAVHMAARSLAARECRVAVAGGVAVNVPHVAGYVAGDGSVFSPDGYCRVFDASARGTVFGSGAAVVVLKRVEDARADGDCIHAVIRGSAINNDGAAKASFTAPAVRGQAAVIEEALRNAGVSADSIGYVEAHGTGTLLGDAIEVRALTKAYRAQTSRRGFCALGSVKTNVGHLDAAAGVTGLIKVVECLKHRELVPTLHYEQPNPQIEFEGSPFYVNTDTRAWETGDGARRAAVSAFGVGGTNAHVIVEEAPMRAASGTGRPFQVLVWSGRTEDAVNDVGRRLAGHLRDSPDVPLADAAYTLQTGRQRMAWRRAAVCRDAAQALDAVEAGGTVSYAAEMGENPGIIFVFPGQGAQHAGMGRELYEREPVFRDHIDECAVLLSGELGLNVRDVLYAGAADGESSLNETWLAQPALFATEYALVKLWESWGVRPAAMIGHSLGEFVAACVAGVLTLEDALRLVTLRGRLMQEMPRGAMLAVELGEEAVGRWLGGDVWLSAVNGANVCTVGGRLDAIAELEQTLRAAGHGVHRLRTSHAYHTPLMTAIADRFIGEVERTPRSTVGIPYISNVTGTWVTDADVADAGYWCRQACERVQFARGVETLLADGERLMVEIGPGQGLSRLIRRRGDVRTCHSMGRAGQSDTEALLTALAHVWTAGAEIDWRGFHAGARRVRVALPTYPFQHKRYWIDPPAASARESSASATPARVQKSGDVEAWFWAPSWALTPSAARAVGRDRAGEGWLVFADDHGLAARLVPRLRAAGADVVTVSIGRDWAQTAPDAFTIDPADAGQYRRLIETLRQDEHGAGHVLQHVLHLWGIVPPEQAPDTSAFFDAFQPAGFYSLLHTARELTGAAAGRLRSLWVVSNDTQLVESVDAPHSGKSSAVALCKILSQETDVRTRFVDLAFRDVRAGADAAGDVLLHELDRDAPDVLVAWRDRRRWRADYAPLPVEKPASAAPFPLRDRGVYVITGGLGAVGELIATQLAETCRARLVLTSRAPLPPRESWPPDADLPNADRSGWLDPASVQKIRAVRAIEAAGGEVRVIAADVSDAEAMRAVVDTCCTELGGVDGMIHAAGITSGDSLFRTIQEATPAHCEEQARPKVHGLYAIEHAIRGLPVDFVLAMSSNAAVLGGLGFLSYAAANAGMDAFVTARAGRHSGTRWLSANWDHWPQETRKYLDVSTSMDEYAMTRDEARTATHIVLTQCDRGQVVVATGDLERRFALWLNRHRVHQPEPTAVALLDDSTLAPRPRLRSAYVAPDTEVEAKMAEIWAAFLGITPVGVNDDFFELGGHSLLAVQMVAEIGHALNRDVPLRALFEGPTIAQLSRALASDAAQTASVD